MAHTDMTSTILQPSYSATFATSYPRRRIVHVRPRARTQRDRVCASRACTVPIHFFRLRGYLRGGRRGEGSTCTSQMQLSALPAYEFLLSAAISGTYLRSEIARRAPTDHSPPSLAINQRPPAPNLLLALAQRHDGGPRGWPNLFGVRRGYRECPEPSIGRRHVRKE